jgi:hypothetical protein
VAVEQPDSPAGREFHELARRLAEELMPPVQMAGCTARIFAAAEARLAALDAAKASPGAGAAG